MSEEIDKHVLRKYEIQQKLGKVRKQICTRWSLACLSISSTLTTQLATSTGLRHRVESR